MKKILIFILFSTSCCGIVPFDNINQEWDDGYNEWLQDNQNSNSDTD